MTDEKCPKCGRFLEKRFTAKTGGYFLGCTGWKDKENPCTYKRDSAGKEIEGPQETDIKCPACGKNMVKKAGRFGVFFTCSGAPECPTTMNLGADGKPVVTALPTAVQVPEVREAQPAPEGEQGGQEVRAVPGPEVQVHLGLRRQGEPGQAAGHRHRLREVRQPDGGEGRVARAVPVVHGLPQVPQREVDQRRAAREAQGHPAAHAGEGRRTTPSRTCRNVEMTDTCPECEAPMRLMKSRFGPGYYLGCTKYPKCKGKGQVSGELQKKIDAALTGGESGAAAT